MKKFFALFAVVFTVLFLTACAKDSSAVGYGLVHGHYVGVVDITVDAKGVVTDVSIEEYYLAYNAAQVADPGATRDDVIPIGTNFFAKYYNVDGKVFVGNAERKWVHPTHGDLEVWVKDESNAKAYVEAVKAGKVYISNAEGVKLTDLTVTGNAAVAMTKSESNYGGTNWDWAGAMTGLEEIFTGTRMNMTYSKITEGDNTGKWLVADAVTSATLVDFADYFAVAKRAYDNATK